MEKSTVRASKETNLKSTQVYLPISEIKDDVIILKNNGMRAILRTNALNFHLKSEKEQDGIIWAFQGFLNSLNDFPIQILIRSRKYDLDKYIKKLEEIAKKQTNRLLKLQTDKYIEFMKYLLEFNIMRKEFYVIVPYDPIDKISMFGLEKLIIALKPADSLNVIKQRYKEFNDNKRKLMTRVISVKSALEQCGLVVQQLNTKEIIQLLYESYNPITSQYQKLFDIDSINIIQV